MEFTPGEAGMINKITQITHLSRFKNFSSTNDNISLGRTNLIYAPNGRGKSSLSDIVASFALNDTQLLQKRISKGYPGNLEVTVQYGAPTQTARFTRGSWSANPTDAVCLVFNKDFIQKNIHTVTVEHDHKKRLHGLIVGEGAIVAKQDVTNKREAHELAKREQRTIGAEFTALGVSGTTLDEFVKMVPGDVVVLEAEKAKLETQVKALGEPEKIKTKPGLSILSKLSADFTDLEETCNNTVQGGSQEAIELLQQHIASHVHSNENEAKEFIAAAVKAQGSKEAASCALCGQDLSADAKAIIDAMFTIFNTSYTQLRKDISDRVEELDENDAARAAAQAQTVMEANAVKHEDWLKYIDATNSLGVGDLTKLAEDVVKKQGSLVKQLTAKREDTSIVIDTELTDFKLSIDIYNQQVEQYNTQVVLINEAIQKYKDSINVSKKQAIEEKIAGVKTAIARCGELGKDLAKRATDNAKVVVDTEAAYKKALQDFATAQEVIINQHKDTINTALEYCGAKFRIDGLQQGTRGNSTEPYIEYSLELQGGEQDAQLTASSGLGDILSDGERNLLAFAFFWSLVVHQDLSKTIVIFDDPLSSIDRDWRTCLAEKLKELHDNGLDQLFVLTHYDDFAQVACRIISGMKELTIEDKGVANGHWIDGVSIEDIVRDEQFARIKMLELYVGDPTTQHPGHIQAEIRKALESALKHKYYQKLQALINGNAGWLRHYIEHVDVKPILQANGSYQELSNLCMAGGWANHDNPSATTFDQNAAQNYARRTLKVLEEL